MASYAELSKKTVVQIRTRDNNPGIVDAVLRGLNNSLGPVVVVNDASDKKLKGNTRGWLQGHLEANQDRLILIDMESGWTWSQALNTGFVIVDRLNEERAIKGQPLIEFVLNTSCEVRWEPTHLECMFGNLFGGQNIGAVGTSFDATQKGTHVKLGKSYLKPRNTFMLVRLAAYKQVGPYDPACDDFGGMEDMHWIIRMDAQRMMRDLLDAESAARVVPYVWDMLDMKVKLLIGVHAHQPTKELRELEAIKKILAYEHRKAALLGDTLAKLNVADLA